MSTESLRSSWREEFAQNLIGERLPEFRALGQRLADRLKSALPADMTTSFDVADPDSPNYYTLTVSAKDADEINSVSFKADFDYLQRKVHIDKFNVMGLRGQGIGHQFFQEFMHECRAARYYTLNLQSSDIGSYFWIGQKFLPDSVAHLCPKIESRLDELAKWLGPDPIETARAILADVRSGQVAKLRDLAQLGYGEDVQAAFASQEFAAAKDRLEFQGWGGPSDEFAAEIFLLAKSFGSTHTPTLGQVLLVGTGWRGSQILQPLEAAPVPQVQMGFSTPACAR